jgi:hypothetical protein
MSAITATPAPSDLGLDSQLQMFTSPQMNYGYGGCQTKRRQAVCEGKQDSAHTYPKDPDADQKDDIAGSKVGRCLPNLRLEGPVGDITDEQHLFWSFQHGAPFPAEEVCNTPGRH